MAKYTLKYCGVNTARFLKYIWLFFNNMQEKINVMNIFKVNEMLCATWYLLYNSKDIENTHGGVLLLVKLQALACNLTESNIFHVCFSR